MASVDNYLRLAKQAFATGRLDKARRYADKAAAGWELARITGNSVRE